MDYSQDYYGMELWKQMLGLSGNPYAQPQMQYYNKQQQQSGGGRSGGGGSSMSPTTLLSLYNKYNSLFGNTQPSVSAEAYDATRTAKVGGFGQSETPIPTSKEIGADLGYSSPATGNGLIAGNEITAPGAYAEVGSAADIGSSAGSGTSLLGGLGYTAGWIGAGMGALHQATQANNRSFEGQATKDIFGGSYATDPWVPTAYQKLGIDSPTAGETFDARWQNKDWKGMAESFPRAGGYWVSPVTSMGYDVVSDKFGKTAANIMFPDQWGLDQIGKLFGKLF